jgi:hypothetical protein
VPRLQRDLKRHLCATHDTEPWKANGGVDEVNYDVDPTIDNFPDFYETRSSAR